MFVLPPPPRYPTQAAYNAALAGGHMQPMIETNNILTHPEGDEHQFLVGEGLYVLKEDLHLATPPPHPSEAPVQNPNPLATNPQAATAGTKISIINLDVGSKAPSFGGGLSIAGLSLSKNGSAGATHPTIQEHPNESDRSTDAGLSSDGGRGPSTDTPANFVMPTAAPVFGQGNAMLASPPAGGKDAGKRRKPKNNMTKSNSSFISRVIIHEGLSKRLQERSTDGMFAFANINRSFQWLDMSTEKKNEYLTKVLFTKAHCLCHDVNRITKTNSHIDIIMGFSTGEVIWWEPMSQRYTRLNKNGAINGTPVSDIRWIPGSENLFLASHMDGSLVVYDKEKEDEKFSPEEEEGEKESSESGESGEAENGTKTNPSSTFSPSRIKVNKSVHSKNQKFNPVAFWKLSHQRINAFAFSPDNRHLAVVSEDGSLRIIDYHKEELLDLFYSYYGGFICVCWSPDGKYVVTGGQDDLISIWSVAESALVARCQGHHSWVTAVAFDPWRCDDRNYRFGSVGDDRRLCLWDFNVGMLHRPKAPASIRQRGSIASRLTTQNTSSSMGRLRSNSSLSNGGEDGGDEKIHEVEPWSRTATLPPVCSKQVDKDPLSWLEFTEDAIMTSCKSGHIRTWNRPTDSVAGVGS